MTMEEQIRKLIEEKIRPALQMDGGDIDFVGIEGGMVQVRLRGACHGCPSARITLQHGVKHAIQAEFPEIQDVVAV